MSLDNINLKNVTLVCVCTVDTSAAIKALKYSMKNIKFGRVLLISNISSYKENEIDIIEIEPFPNVGEWGRFIVFELHKYIYTDHAIIIHPDGFIVNPFSWQDKWLEFDFIGPPFKIPNDKVSYRDANGNLQRVGNGISLRSKRLLELPSQIGLRWENFDEGLPHEDGFLTVQHRLELQKHGIKYADLVTAAQFGREAYIPEHKGVKPFVFHKWKGYNMLFPCFNRKEVFLKNCKKLKRKLLKYAKNN